MLDRIKRRIEERSLQRSIDDIDFIIFNYVLGEGITTGELARLRKYCKIPKLYDYFRKKVDSELNDSNIISLLKLCRCTSFGVV